MNFKDLRVGDKFYKVTKPYTHSQPPTLTTYTIKERVGKCFVGKCFIVDTIDDEGKIWEDVEMLIPHTSQKHFFISEEAATKLFEDQCHVYLANLERQAKRVRRKIEKRKRAEESPNKL
jgi:hypothetical protein